MGALHIPITATHSKGRVRRRPGFVGSPAEGSGHATLHAVASYFNESRRGESPTPRADVLGPMVAAASPGRETGPQARVSRETRGARLARAPTPRPGRRAWGREAAEDALRPQLDLRHAVRRFPDAETVSSPRGHARESWLGRQAHHRPVGDALQWRQFRDGHPSGFT